MLAIRKMVWYTAFVGMLNLKEWGNPTLSF